MLDASRLKPPPLRFRKRRRFVIVFDRTRYGGVKRGSWRLTTRRNP